MYPQHSPLFDVIIAGAGPVGLFLACELRLQGVSVLVLEQASDPHSALKQLPFGLRGLSAPTLEALYRRGLLDALRAAQAANTSADDTARAAHWLQQPRQPAGHFAGIPFYLDDVDSSRWPFRLPSPAGTQLAVTLDTLETVLAQRASELGVDIRRGYRVSGFEASADTVVVEAGAQRFSGRWLVACDGGRSSVRKLGGFAFEGTAPEFTGYSIQAELADPAVLTPGRHYTAEGMYTYARPGTLALVDFDGGAFHRSQPLTLAHVQSVLRRVSAAPVTLTRLELATTWTDRACQATAYRHGRVLLAGDAAHVHSPLGGQGLNLGVGDAINLGWKLAACVRGDAPVDLLDTYQQERYPVGAAVLDWSRAQVALMRPTPSTRALAAVLREVIATPDAATWFAERIWGVSLRYETGGEPAATHPLVGRSTPDFQLQDGTQLGSLLHDGKGCLLCFGPSASGSALIAPWRARVNFLAAPVKDSLGLSAVLLRPDGVVAWASSVDAPLEADASLKAALQRWFGLPHPAPRAITTDSVP
ncbi:FAD-dependent monooxygenase [Silvimonas sp. JCM 19000]